MKYATIKLVCLGYGVVVSITLFFSYVLFPGPKQGTEFISIGEAFVASVLIAPIVETYLVQHTFLQYSQKWVSRYWPGLVLSSLVFAGLHYYSVPYVIKTLFSGFAYGFFYIQFARIKGYPMWNTALIHAMHNLTGFCLNHLF